jgi:hypothetical protein
MHKCFDLNSFLLVSTPLDNRLARVGSFSNGVERMRRRAKKKCLPQNMIEGYSISMRFGLKLFLISNLFIHQIEECPFL